MTGEPKTLRIYSTSDGRKPFQEWIDSLNDYNAQARVLVRLERVRLGSLGDWKCGGKKATQRKDIADAKRYWQDYRRVSSDLRKKIRASFFWPCGTLRRLTESAKLPRRAN